MKTFKTLLQLVTFATLTFSSISGNAQSLLWEISGNGLEKPSYLYGTIHLTCPNDLVISDAVKKAFDKTEQLVLELDMDAPDFMQKAQKLSMNPGMKNFSDQLNEEDKKLINDFLQKNYNANLAQLGILKPFTLQSMVLMKTLDCPQPASYEASFMKISKEQKEEVLGIEKMEDQFKIFDGIPQKVQLEWLVKYLKEFDSTKKEMQEIITAYKNEDLKEIQKITLKNPEYKDYLDALLTDRNKKWIPKIETIVKSKPTIFGVGAAHLPGKNGVIELLKKKGYNLKAVKQ